MNIWIDAQLSPALAIWIKENYSVDATAVRELGLRDATDPQIFEAARQASAIVMTKDKDFLDLINRLGPPPKVIWLTCGNTSNKRLKKILSTTLESAIALLESGETIVEIRDLG